MHSKDELPYWLQNLTLSFREENEDEGDNEGENEGEEAEETEEEEDAKSEGGSEEGEDLAAKLAATEKALADERRLRRKIERESKRNARKKSSESKDKNEEELKQQLEKSTTRTEKLAAGLLKKEIQSAVLKEARKQGFIDETDALVDDVLKEIDADQDEEDPTEIDVDLDSVRDAVKELASKKKHLVGKNTPGEPSGGKFRKKSSDDGKPSDQVLQEYYPGLR